MDSEIRNVTATAMLMAKNQDEPITYVLCKEMVDMMEEFDSHFLGIQNK